MRQIFTSPRLENVESVAKLLTDAGIENKLSDDRGYKQVSRREFSYVQKNSSGKEPAVWVIKSDDYKRARELLSGMGLIEPNATASYLPDALQFKEVAKPDMRRRVNRIRIVLFAVVGAMAAWVAMKMLFMP